MENAGYSGTPLAKKLGVKAGQTIKIFWEPKPYLEFFDDFPEDVQFLKSEDKTSKIDFAHLFVYHPKLLRESFAEAKQILKPNGIIWVSWPKKSSGILTDLDKFLVMKIGKEMGLVDVKIAAIDEGWSGLKFVYRVTDRIKEK